MKNQFYAQQFFNSSQELQTYINKRHNAQREFSNLLNIFSKLHYLNVLGFTKTLCQYESSMATKTILKLS